MNFKYYHYMQIRSTFRPAARWPKVRIENYSNETLHPDILHNVSKTGVQYSYSSHDSHQAFLGETVPSHHSFKYFYCMVIGKW